MIFACTTIHKKNFCSRKKYPKHQSICDDTECFRDFKFVGCTSVKAAASKWLSFFIFFKNFTYNFFLFIHNFIFNVATFCESRNLTFDSFL